MKEYKKEINIPINIFIIDMLLKNISYYFFLN